MDKEGQHLFVVDVNDFKESMFILVGRGGEGGEQVNEGTGGKTSRVERRDTVLGVHTWDGPRGTHLGWS